MDKRRIESKLRLWTCVAWLCLSSMLVGCSSSSRLFFPQERSPMLESTQSLRQPMPAPLPRELAKQVHARYIVEAGDTLHLVVTDPNSNVRIPGDQPVLLDGTINLGQYGHLVVAGKTVDEIEGMVKASVDAQTKDAGFISVRLVGRQSKVFYVFGEVNAPGAFPLTGRETVLDGIVSAGGLTDSASHKNIVMTRPTPPDSCRIVLPICYDEIVQHGNTTTNYQLSPGDRIFVASRSCTETFFRNKNKVCPPCGMPQEPCPLPPLKPNGTCPAAELATPTPLLPLAP